MIAILMSTFDRYEKLARWTAAQIQQQWEQHPPLFYSGLRGDDPQYLNYLGDSQDWMSVTLHAVEELQQRGFTHAYLVLDDHPPVGSCHEKALNEILPALAIKLKATYIGLLGYGQHREVAGKILKQQDFFLEQSSQDYGWKFSLHPGLWNLEGLRTLLLERIQAHAEENRTAWNFETHKDVAKNPKLTSLMTSSYRIKGSVFLKMKWQMKWKILCEALERFFADVMLFKARLEGGATKREAVQKKLFWRYGHYLGAYPLFWSGVMQRGKPHADWERWLQHSGNVELQSSWGELKQVVFPSASSL